jgi:hypothetical protein
MLSQVRSGYVRLSQVSPDYATLTMLKQHRSFKAWLGQVISVYVKLFFVRPRQVRKGQFRTG